MTAPTGDVTSRVQEVEERSTVFRKELGLLDLALAQILYVVGTGWVGTAAKLGDQHVFFWLTAIVLYYLPQAAVVVYLNRLMPLEGGLYQWASVGFGKFGGFLTAWNLWAYTIAVMGTFAIGIATNLSYAFGPDARAMTTSAAYTPIVSTLIIAGTAVLAVLGLRTSKWLQNAGGVAQFVTYLAVLAVPLFAMRRGQIAEFHPLAASPPALSWYNLNIMGKMALGALSGFEYVAILAGECRNPARTISRSVLIAVPVIACMFIFGTSSVVALVPRDSIDLVSPIPQVLTIGFQGYAFARVVVPLLIVVMLVRQLGSVTLIFAGNTRLPMVAGWDGLLPARFTKLHPRLRTPVFSIVVVDAITIAVALTGQIGVGLQEAFQLVENVSGILYSFTYMSLFAIPIFAMARLSERPPLWLRAAATSGFAVSVMYSILSVFPIIDVPNWRLFAAKIVATLVVVEAMGLALYVAGRRAGAAPGRAGAAGEGPGGG
jgi:amino acid transporter